MVRSSDFSRRFRHCFAAWPAAYVVGVVALALGGCGLDRSGLENALIGDGGSRGNDAAADRIGGGAGGNGGSGGSIVATGGDSGAGGGIVVDGSGGIIGGSGGIIGAGGMIIGSGGIPGAGGAIVGTGGMPGAGGAIVSTGGMPGAGGTIVGTGGRTDGGTDAGAADAGTDGGGLGGHLGGLGGGPGTGDAGTGGMGAAGAPGLGGAGGATMCTPPCGPCQRCGANHTCELDPASFWDLSAVLASIDPHDPNVKPPNTSDWDLPSGEIGGSLPDPFVELDFLSTAITPIGHTATITDTLLPNWGALMGPTAAQLNPMGAPVRASDLLAGGKNWQISVFDEDVDTAIGPFGETICGINGPLTSADFINGSFTRTNVDSCSSVSIKLTCHP